MVSLGFDEILLSPRFLPSRSYEPLWRGSSGPPIIPIKVGSKVRTKFRIGLAKVVAKIRTNPLLTRPVGSKVRTIGSFRVEISTRFRRDFDSDFKSDFVTILRRTSGYMPGMLLQAALQPLFWMGGNEGGRGRMTAGYSARRGTGADKSEIMMVTESHLKSSSKSAANLSRNRLEICTTATMSFEGLLIRRGNLWNDIDIVEVAEDDGVAE
ncbi:hypothetical protein B0H11DRAFT_1932974 [Mycena galericulata]|nr:hypothetical protein B0H11DRAFT_1932974 [Mycena galericulata]